jgi:hypothetical protein
MREKVEAGKKVHDSIARIVYSRVFLNEHLEVFWTAFWTLIDSRDIGFGLGSIKLAEIAAYAEMFDFEPGSILLEELVWAVRILDSEYLTIQEERRKAEAAKNPNRPRGE